MNHTSVFHLFLFFFFFFNDTPTTEIYTLSLHDALPISGLRCRSIVHSGIVQKDGAKGYNFGLDRKSTRLNSSHTVRSYAVCCLKKTDNDPALASRTIKLSITWHSMSCSQML